MAKIIRPKKAAEEKKSDSGKPVQKVLQFRMDVMVSNGNGDRGTSFEEFQSVIREMIKERYPTAQFTPSGGYYLIDGKVCRPTDFDWETMDRKPGTYPPLWSLTAQEQMEVKQQQRIREDAARANTLSRQPPNLRTSRELDELKKITAQEKGRTLRSISKERPDLVSPAEVEKVAPARSTKRIIRKPNR